MKKSLELLHHLIDGERKLLGSMRTYPNEGNDDSINDEKKSSSMLKQKIANRNEKKLH